jgi:type IV pilus biogenesis protein CpaD/CtpE
VVGILRALKLFLMAAVTRRRHRIEIAERTILVAVVAGRCRMRAGQRKTVHVLIDLLHRNFPSPDGMAGLAIRAHLALVNVSVAVGALVADVAEDHLGVARRAGHTFVQTP